MQILNNRQLNNEERRKIAAPYIKNHAEKEDYSRSNEVLDSFVGRNTEKLKQLGDLLNRVHG